MCVREREREREREKCDVNFILYVANESDQKVKEINIDSLFLNSCFSFNIIFMFNTLYYIDIKM